MKHHHSQNFDVECEHQLTQSEIESTLQSIRDQLPPHIKAASHSEQVNYIFEQTRRRQKEKEHNQLRTSYLQLIEKHYKPLHPMLRDIKNWEIDESLQRACSLGLKEEILKLLVYVGPGLYTFNFLSSSTCDLLISEVEHFEKWCIQYNVAPQRPNSMNNYGALLDDLGFKEVLDEIMHNYVEPFSKILYPYVGYLDDHHGFIVEYQIGKDVKLDFHVDDSEVTLNVCLGKQFKEGHLYFGGVRCALHQQTKPEKSEEIYVSHQPGVALIHSGKHRHAAQKITSGHRINLILWCRSTSFREQSDGYCPEWCYYH